MKRFHLVNNLTGWLVFLVAAITYCCTVEPTASFWDCPEFISTAFKLEVGHPPGAPFFMLTGNFFSQFTSDPSQVAYCVNIMSALLSAFCILFLFWSITHLTRKLVCPNGIPATTGQLIVVMAAGICGALAYTWSDTFWFSAVEGEVYAYSSMFTALVFWLILKWEDAADEPRADRYLVLIFYLAGLSIGVHLLNLLCLPAITLVYYFKKHPRATARGSLAALAVSMVLVGAVLYGVVPGIVKVGGWFELFFVNTLGLGFNSGLIVYLVVLVAVVLSAIRSTSGTNRRLISVLYVLSVALLGIPFIGHGTRAIIIGFIVLGGLAWLLQHKVGNGQYALRKRFLNTSLLCMLMLMIGYSSYAVIVIRSTQNTPMDQNSPEDIFSLGYYLSREQYGDTPLFYGESFLSTPCYQRVKKVDPATGIEDFATYTARDGSTQYQLNVMTEDKTRVQRHEKKNPDEPDRYDEVNERGNAIYASSMKMLFPRIHSQAHSAAYRQWLGGVTTHEVEASWDTPYGPEQTYGDMPSQADNLRFFLSYQMNFMYWRYFMWNFAGRQNDIQGHGEPEHGNWITGIPFIDNALYGDQSQLPDALKQNKGHNVFFCLPLLLGLLGLFWQAYRGRRGVQQFWVVFFLFFMTGIAIVLYLNQTPQQPRERDYAYAGSFYAFAIWIGIGIAALYDALQRLAQRYPALRLTPGVAVTLVSLVALGVPAQMVSQTWDDHDRSGRYACRDFGLNYLNTLPEEGHPIIFTNGDNDTFPLWYAQDTEGKRTDARVCNLSYLQTDWYTDQMRRPAYDSPSLPIAWNRYEYVDNRGKGFDYYEVRPEMREELDREKARTGKNTYELTYLIDTYVRGRVAEDRPGVMPTDSFVVHVNRENVLRQGMMLPGGKDSIPEYISVSLRGKGSLSKSEMMIYELLARNDWKRPMYMSVTLGASNRAGLDSYLVLEGLAYRITPFRHDGEALAIDTEKMYKNFMHRFAYGNVGAPGVYLDETVSRMCLTHRNMLALLVDNLLREGKRDKALAALRKSKAMLPEANIPYDNYDYNLADLWLQAGDRREAVRVGESVGRYAMQYLRYISSLSDERMQNLLPTCRQMFSTLYEVYGILDRADKAAARRFGAQLTALEQLPAAHMVSAWLEQQQAAEQQNAAMQNLGGDTGGDLFGASEEDY